MRIDRDKAPGHVQLQPFQAKALGARAAAHGDQHALGRQGKFVGPGIAHMHALLRVVAGHAAAQVQHHAAALQGFQHGLGQLFVIAGQHALGGIVSTPVINHPEVAIVGVNRMVERPMLKNGQVVARQLMNLSSSFDHRVVDGMDAAQFIQAIRALLETPALLFVD